MLRSLFACTIAILAGVAIFVDHQILFGLACIIAGACIMSWPTKR